MNYTTFKSKKIHYNSYGKGFPVVLLHGFCEDSSMWNNFRDDLLEEKYKVITIDLPGFGHSEVIPAISIEDMAHVVHQIVEELQLESIILIGHSMGGYVALAYAENYGAQLKGLGMFHSHPYEDTDAVRQNRQKGIDFIQQFGHELYVKRLIPNYFSEKYIGANGFQIDKLILKASQNDAQGIIAAQQAMMKRPDKTEVLKKIACPVWFIVGKLDTTVEQEKSIGQTHLPSVADIHILEKVGHMGMFEAEKETQKLLRQFLLFCLESGVVKN